MRKADNLPASCTVVTKPGNLNFLEPSGPVTGLIYLSVSVTDYVAGVTTTVIWRVPGAARSSFL